MELARLRSADALVPLLRGHGTRTAPVQGELSVDYSALADRVEVARRAYGRVRRLVLVVGAHDVGTVAAYLGALAGGHPVLLVPGEDERHVQGWVRSYDPDVVVRPGGRLTERRTGTAHVLHPELALLLSTSGSTGSPKLVRLSWRNVRSNAEAIARVLGIGPEDRAVTTLPMAYCYGLSVLHSHLLRGARVVLTDLSVLDRCFWDLCRAQRVTSLAGVPHTYQLLDRVGFLDMDLPDLRCLTQAGGRLPPEQVRRYAGGDRQLHVMYGQTEATARMAHLPPHLALQRPEAVGRAVPGGELRVDGETGELVYRGPNVMLGYAQEPSDLALGRTVHELRTGDLARVAPDGLVEIVGRRARFAKLFGLRVDLEAVERGLAEGGTTAWCTGEQDALQVLVEGQRDPVHVQRAAAGLAGLPGHAVHVVAVDALPRQGSGKVDATAARSMLGAPAPTATTGASARAVLAEVLGRPDAREDDTFVGLGGDSLSYVEAAVRLEQLLGDLPPDWPTTPASRLVPATGRRGRPRRTVDVTTLLRAVGIVLVVASHVHLSPLLGGAHALLAVAGYNLARFRMSGAGRRRARGLWAAARRLAVPSAVVIALASLVTAQVGPAQVLLLNGLLGPEALGPAWRYWFVEALVHLVLLTALLLHVPLLDRAERSRPFAFALGVLALGLLPRLGAVDLGDGPAATQTAAGTLWVFALGWCAARAAAPHQQAVVAAVAVLLLPGTFATSQQGLVVLAAVLLLLLVRRGVALPGATGSLRPAVTALAGASLWIYLLHWQVLDLVPAGSPALELALCLAVGLAVSRTASSVGRALPDAGDLWRARTGATRPLQRPVTPRGPACARS